MFRSSFFKIFAFTATVIALVFVGNNYASSQNLSAGYAYCTSLTASPSTVPYGGGYTTLSWTSYEVNGMHSITRFYPGGSTDVANGSRTVWVSSPTTFSVQAVSYFTGLGSTCNTTVYVAAPVPATSSSKSTSPAPGTAAPSATASR